MSNRVDEDTELDLLEGLSGGPAAGGTNTAKTSRQWNMEGRSELDSLLPKTMFSQAPTRETTLPVRLDGPDVLPLRGAVVR